MFNCLGLPPPPRLPGIVGLIDSYRICYTNHESGRAEADRFGASEGRSPSVRSKTKVSPRNGRQKHQVTKTWLTEDEQGSAMWHTSNVPTLLGLPSTPLHKHREVGKLLTERLVIELLPIFHLMNWSSGLPLTAKQSRMFFRLPVCPLD